MGFETYGDISLFLRNYAFNLLDLAYIFKRFNGEKLSVRNKQVLFLFGGLVKTIREIHTYYWFYGLREKAHEQGLVSHELVMQGYGDWLANEIVKQKEATKDD